jgi:serine/threonine-protein kinase RsbT
MASTIGKRVGEDYGLNKSQQTKLIVSIMELTRNIVFYAKKGELFIKPIPSYGIGLSGVKRLIDEFEITSTVNFGTKVRAVKWLNEGQASRFG